MGLGWSPPGVYYVLGRGLGDIVEGLAGDVPREVGQAGY